MVSTSKRFGRGALRLLEEIAGCTYKLRREGLAQGEQRRCRDDQHRWTNSTRIFCFIVRGCVVCGLIDRATLWLVRYPSDTQVCAGVGAENGQSYLAASPGMCVVCGRLIADAEQQVCIEECSAIWLGWHFVVFAERQRLMRRDVAELFVRHLAGGELTDDEQERYERWREQASAAPHVCFQRRGGQHLPSTYAAALPVQTGGGEAGDRNLSAETASRGRRDVFQLRRRVSHATHVWRQAGLSQGERRCCDAGQHIWSPPTRVLYLTMEACQVCGLPGRSAFQDPWGASRIGPDADEGVLSSRSEPGICLICGRLVAEAWLQVCSGTCAQTWIDRQWIVFANPETLMPRAVAEFCARHVSGASLTDTERELYLHWRAEATQDYRERDSDRPAQRSNDDIDF